IGSVGGDGMHVHHAEQARHLILHPHPIFERAQVIAQMQRVGGLHARKNQRFMGHGISERSRKMRAGYALRPAWLQVLADSRGATAAFSRFSTASNRVGCTILWPK